MSPWQMEAGSWAPLNSPLLLSFLPHTSRSAAGQLNGNPFNSKVRKNRMSHNSILLLGSYDCDSMSKAS